MMQDITDTKPTPTENQIGMETHFAIERFLFAEAGLLDRRDYRNWLALLTEDVTYRVLAYVNRDADLGPLPYAIIDEPAFRLKARVEQILNAKLTHAENPPTLTRRFISNVTAAASEREGEFMVTSNLLVFRTRPTLTEGALYAGERTDTLRHVDGALRIARREVRLDQSIIHGSISTLF
jgi:3-phenylpropionate/cinnamic acid dioxygenase small subunit